jgi:hypothetical protein
MGLGEPFTDWTIDRTTICANCRAKTDDVLPNPDTTTKTLADQAEGAPPPPPPE